MTKDKTNYDLAIECAGWTTPAGTVYAMLAVADAVRELTDTLKGVENRLIGLDEAIVEAGDSLGESITAVVDDATKRITRQARLT